MAGNPVEELFKKLRPNVRKLEQGLTKPANITADKIRLSVRLQAIEKATAERIKRTDALKKAANREIKPRFDNFRTEVEALKGTPPEELSDRKVMLLQMGNEVKLGVRKAGEMAREVSDKNIEVNNMIVEVASEIRKAMKKDKKAETVKVNVLRTEIEKPYREMQKLLDDLKKQEKKCDEIQLDLQRQQKVVTEAVSTIDQMMKQVRQAKG